MDKTIAAQPHPPPEAFHFQAAPFQLAAIDEGSSGPRRLQGVAYSGQIIRNHWFWGNVVFDVSTTSAPDRIPVLIEHDRGQRAGFCGLDIGQEIALRDGVLLANEHGTAVAEESDAGFPWQMSVHIEPGSIEEVQTGASVSVNGQTLDGPLVVFHQNRIREVSLTPTGYDPNTRALAASLGAVRPQKESSMNLEELQAQVTQFSTRVSDLETSLAAERRRADDAEAALKATRVVQRTEAVKALFSAVGLEFTEAAAAPYLVMEETAFSAVSEQLKGLKPKPSAHLFRAQATDGAAEGRDGDKPKTGSLAAAASKFSVKAVSR